MCITALRFQLVIALLVSAILMLSACTPPSRYRYIFTPEYKKLDIAPETMSESIEIGSNIEVETKKLIYRVTVTGYEDDEYLIGIEEFDGREVRIPFDDIIEIGTGAPSYEETYYKKDKNFSDSIIEMVGKAAALVIAIVIVSFL